MISNFRVFNIDLDYSAALLERALADIVLLGAVCGVLWKWPGKLMRDKIKSRRAAIGMIPKLATDMQIVLAELTPNHGTSIKDAVHRIENEILPRMQDRVDYGLEALRSYWSNGPQAMFECDEDGLIIWTNKSFQTLTSLTFSEALGRGWRSIIMPEDVEMTVSAGTAARIDGRRLDIKFRAINGKYLHVESEPLYAQKKLLGWFGTVTDITNDMKD